MTIPRLLSQRIGFRLLLSILAASVVATSLTTVVQLYFRYQRDLAEIDTQRQEIERTFLPVLTENLWTADREQARLLLNGLVQLPDLQYAAVRTPKGQIFASASLGSPPPFQKAITFATPIIHRYKGEPLALGSLELIFSLVPLQGRLHNDALIILLTEGGRIFFVSICILLIVHQLVTRHLARISDYLQRFDIEKSDLPLALTRTRREEQDELAAVVESINLLRSRLLDSRQEQEQLFASLRNSRDQLTSKVEELE
ncbi:MAG: hypothetical protein OEV91_02870, partial [Desulfobulbaceae bacterium]|nr:hypothetical protein [Desulfobulbaceae bacterium]